MKKYYGQFYSKELNSDIKLYKDIIFDNKEKTFFEPFVGEGDLLFIYLEIMEEFGFSPAELFKKEKIKCFDISKENILKLKNKLYEIGFKKEDIDKAILYNDSLKNNPLKDKDAFIITNPPYLYKVPAKKLNYDMSYFEKYTDLYEVAIDLYKEYNGIWIVPSNIFYSTHVKVLKEIIENIENINIYENPKFSDTDISITIFNINKDIKNKKIELNGIEYQLKDKKIYFPEISTASKTYKYKFGFYEEDNEKDGIEYTTDTNEKVSTFLDVENSLIIKMFDSTKKQDIGIYEKDLIITEDILFNKISSRMYFQVFFENEIDKEKVKKLFNKKIENLRKKYKSAFLTNFLSVSKKNSFSRKRMSIGQAKYILNEVIKEI